MADATDQADFELCELDRDDGPAIVAILNKVFRTKTSLAAWDWYAHRSSWGAGRVYGARNRDGRVVACYGVVPVRIRVDGDMIEAGYGHHLAVDPAVRGITLFVELSRAVMSGEEARGVRVVLGAANARAYPLHRRLAGWRDAGILDVASYVRPVAQRGAAELTALSFDATAVDLMRRAVQGTRWHFERDVRWLEWRYHERPGVPYEPLALRDGSTLAAWGVLKRYRDPAGPVRAHVMELWATESAAATCWLKGVVSRVAGCDEVTAWVSRQSPLHASFNEAGFTFPADRRQPLLVRPLAGAPQLSDPCMMALGDADGF